MTEPTTSAVGAVYGAKFAISSGFGAVVAAVIVMSMAYPKTRREFVAALVSTLALSIFGGAAAIEYFNIGHWGYIAQGLAFVVCGLPAWVAVRAFFAWSEANKQRGIVELLRQIRSAWTEFD